MTLLGAGAQGMGMGIGAGEGFLDRPALLAEFNSATSEGQQVDHQEVIFVSTPPSAGLEEAGGGGYFEGFISNTDGDARRARTGPSGETYPIWKGERLDG